MRPKTMLIFILCLLTQLLMACGDDDSTTTDTSSSSSSGGDMASSSGGDASSSGGDASSSGGDTSSSGGDTSSSGGDMTGTAIDPGVQTAFDDFLVNTDDNIAALCSCLSDPTNDFCTTNPDECFADTSACEAEALTEWVPPEEIASCILGALSLDPTTGTEMITCTSAARQGLEDCLATVTACDATATAACLDAQDLAEAACPEPPPAVIAALGACAPPPGPADQIEEILTMVEDDAAAFCECASDATSDFCTVNADKCFADAGTCEAALAAEGLNLDTIGCFTAAAELDGEGSFDALNCHFTAQETYGDCLFEVVACDSAATLACGNALEASQTSCSAMFPETVSAAIEACLTP